MIRMKTGSCWRHVDASTRVLGKWEGNMLVADTTDAGFRVSDRYRFLLSTTNVKTSSFQLFSPSLSSTFLWFSQAITTAFDVIRLYYKAIHWITLAFLRYRYLLHTFLSLSLLIMSSSAGARSAKKATKESKESDAPAPPAAVPTASSSEPTNDTTNSTASSPNRKRSAPSPPTTTTTKKAKKKDPFKGLSPGAKR